MSKSPFSSRIMAAKTAVPLMSSIKELYELAKRSMTKEIRSNPIKILKSTKRIDINNLSNFFEDKTQLLLNLQMRKIGILIKKYQVKRINKD
ncbi:unnamed protein product [Blepharisma stoltei]|uniref:Uncharacterized protein n=1 Tax=Blepharisma stoltei TaxID=1481888 RepID=A0AAU9IE33_9CILI|nr:unnamed protein product [Blepharisma stoltei]